MTILIDRADFTDPRLAVFLQSHLDDLAPTAPAESRHALDLTELQGPQVRMWVVDDGESIVGTAALAALEPAHEELKSMRTDPRHRGRGVAKGLLEHVVADARSRGVSRISLETGTMDFFAPARALYARAGFVVCGPFGSYGEDPNSTFMTLSLTPSTPGSAAPRE
ncbi:GNAT family N-acetyltransferase [Mumia sp. Pv 4-285]|uniref:GNAT family N-acetyltransferase n=1 Tax=Mumia qirimensis TaxID=3234852 RepID=UPI00351D37D6